MSFLTAGWTCVELLDQVTVDTLVRGGRIYAFTESQVPGGGDVAAVFRY